MDPTTAKMAIKLITFWNEQRDVITNRTFCHLWLVKP